MHAFTLKEGHVVDLQQLRAEDGMLLQDESDSHVLQCAQLTSISNHFSTVAHMIGHTFTLQNPQVTNSEG